jgi:hypothetical protein
MRPARLAMARGSIEVSPASLQSEGPLADGLQARRIG